MTAKTVDSIKGAVYSIASPKLPSLDVIVSDDNVKALERYLKEKPERLSEVDKEGKTLLILLIQSLAFACAKLVIQKYPQNINHTDVTRRSALHYACQMEQADLVQLLVQNEALAFAKDVEGMTPFHIAIQKEQLECILLFSQLPPEKVPKELFQEHEITPLHLAASRPLSCFRPVLQMANRLRVNLDLKDERGMTALHHAVTGKTPLESLRALLQYHIQFDIVASTGHTALSLACRDNNEQVANLLLINTANPTLGNPPPLLHAYLNDSRDLAQKLIANGASPEVTAGKDHLHDIAYVQGNDRFNTLLHITRKMQAPICQTLEKKEEGFLSFLKPSRLGQFSKADLEGKKHFAAIEAHPLQNSHLHELVLHSDIDFDLLYSATPKEGWDLTNRLGETPFFHLCKRGTLATCIRLQQHAPNVNCVDKERNTILHASLQAENMLLFYYLCTQFKFLINTQNARGETPLHIAVKMGAYFAVVFLLKLGANPLLLDRKHNSVLHMAGETLNEYTVQIIDHLVAKKVPLEGPNVEGKTAVYVAWERGNAVAFNQLLRLGVTLDAVNIKGDTLLISACKTTHYNGAEQLVLAGADRSQQTVITTALIATCKLGACPELVQLLVSKNIGPVQKASQAASPNRVVGRDLPLLVLIQQLKDPTNKCQELPQFKMLEILLQNGAKPDKTVYTDLDQKVKTSPLIEAIRRKLTPVVRKLLEYKADPNKKPHGNIRPLKLACELDLVDIAKALIEKGATVSKKLQKLEKLSQRMQEALRQAKRKSSSASSTNAPLQRTDSFKVLGKKERKEKKSKKEKAKERVPQVVPPAPLSPPSNSAIRPSQQPQSSSVDGITWQFRSFSVEDVERLNQQSGSS